MTITQKSGDGFVELALAGRLDTVTAPDLEKVIDELPEETKELILDFSGLEYVSSAGLRVLLAAQKRMNQQGCMKIRKVRETILEIFEITGFSDILTIEP